ncbi:MAG: hypothetical protein ACR2QU_04095, partial [Gammaproteobacteria bacterium]
MTLRQTLLRMLGLLLLVSSIDTQAQTLKERSADQIRMADATVDSAEKEVERAEQQLADTLAELEEASKSARALYDEAKAFENEAAEIRRDIWLKTEEKQKELEALAGAVDQQAAARFERWLEASKPASTVKKKELQARGDLKKARTALQQAIAERSATREKIENSFKENHPPHLAVVRVFGEEGVVYHGVWVPEKEILDRRIAVLAAAIAHFPVIVDQVVADRSAMIDN